METRGQTLKWLQNEQLQLKDLMKEMKIRWEELEEKHKQCLGDFEEFKISANSEMDRLREKADEKQKIIEEFIRWMCANGHSSEVYKITGMNNEN